MGADQIGYVFKGPRRLDRSDTTIAAAQARGIQVLCALRNLQARSALPKRLPSALGHLSRDEVENILDQAHAFPDSHAAVRNLLEWWASGARDTCTRVDPDDPTQIIGFAGEPSWGDEPGGFGYSTYKVALCLDILKFFGIR
jgi:hypothetical protein